MSKHYFLSYIETLKATLDEIDYVSVEKIINKLIEAKNNDKQIFIIGNGGSAATASHFACDLAKGTIDYNTENFKRFRAISLTDNIPFMTAIGNDISYDDIFVEQLKNYLNPEDVLIVISASGNSPNILKALYYAKKVNAYTIGLLGFEGGKAKKMLDIPLIIRSYNYGISEDFHIIIEHIMTQIIRIKLAQHKEKVIFLDRDGIINKKPLDHNYVTGWHEFEFNEDIFPVLKSLKRNGFRFIVVTNQQGIGKGLFSEDDLIKIHDQMTDYLLKDGIKIDKIYFCPHLEEDQCYCRKPRPGLFYKAQNELPYMIDIENSFLIGDSLNDVIAGKNFGLKTILVNSNSFKTNGCDPDFMVNNLYDILEIIH